MKTTKVDRHISAAADAITAADEELKAEEIQLKARLEEIARKREDLGWAWSALGLPCSQASEPTRRPVELPSAAGMTDHIRSILMTNRGVEFTPTEVRDQLQKSGFALEGRSNPMAEIHLILKRLKKQDGRFTSRRDSRRGSEVYKFWMDLPADCAISKDPDGPAQLKKRA